MIQSESNTTRLYSIRKPVRKKVTRLRVNACGFYTVNGNNFLDFLEDSKVESIKGFLRGFTKANEGKTILLTIDNFSTHKSKEVRELAAELGIYFVYLPKYSPDLNPIEYTWKSTKREVSVMDADNEGEMKYRMKVSWEEIAKNKGFAKSWIEKFMVGDFYSQIIATI